MRFFFFLLSDNLITGKIGNDLQQGLISWPKLFKIVNSNILSSFDLNKDSETSFVCDLIIVITGKKIIKKLYLNKTK